MNSTNNHNASAAASARELGLSAAYPLNIVKDEPTSVSQIAAVGLPSPHQFSSAGVSVEKPHKNSSGTPASTVSDPSMKDYSHKMNNFAPKPGQSSHQQASFRRGIRPQLPGDWHDSYHQNHMGRREHDHLDCNPHTSFSGRDAQQHQLMHPTMINPRTAIFFPGTDHDMHFTIAKQIEYYFSPRSLWKNYSLREHMDEQGWVSVSVIARLPQVEQLMKGISAKDKDQYILDTVRRSRDVETKDNMIRKCGDWMMWILPQSKDGNSTKPEMKQSYLKYQRGEGTSEGTL
ncbi:hypothetical protein C5167_003710 [Papaver somniferum]|uniref:HTH La-type RNA-binding domain-containing protein n=1 Tax=Papaver somniferum TaxID=3469 RepID=A0A4Y7L1C4_PAPSO|nr:hypothetical protein C5167_003710 [Papaver somniferum]